ncbi:MAG: hypothetical protein U9Q40_05150 [Campylobacterota bacterium]|nr:hypothetical protein [Campylobacterota bacterium]
MKHTYLSETTVKEALQEGAITAQEADCLMVKIEDQVSIFKAMSK